MDTIFKQNCAYKTCRIQRSRDDLSEGVMPELFPKGVSLLISKVLRGAEEGSLQESATGVRMWMVVLEHPTSQGCLEPKDRR